MSLTRYTATDLARFLDGGAAPVYVLDEDRRIIFCNAACASWLGLKVEALLGQQCNYHAPVQSPSRDGSADQPVSHVAGLCPPPQVFSGRATAALVTCRRPDDGQVVHRRGQFLPLARGEDERSRSSSWPTVLPTLSCRTASRTSCCTSKCDSFANRWPAVFLPIG
jgi:PAS domain-containing protein